MQIGDRAKFTAGESTVVVTIGDVRDDGLVLVQNEPSGAGAYSFLVRADLLDAFDDVPVTV